MTIKIPNYISVVHDEEYKGDIKNVGVDTLYFRLKHNLQSIEAFTLEKMFKFHIVDVTSMNDLKEIVSIINVSYTDIHVDLEQVNSWIKSKVFDADLWLFIIDTNKQKPVGLGVAECDKDVREGMLEWIQVLPEYRGRKIGEAIVKKLLMKLSSKVDFVTVSGQVNNKTNPEILYRKCGFVGNDIWHVIEN